MRRKDREVTDFQEIIAIMEKCDVCRLGLNDGDYPYILPLNFGLEVQEGKATLYFHSALEGHKLELFQRNSHVSFEMDCMHKLEYFPEKGYCTMSFASVMGRGRIRILEEEEKAPALQKLIEHYRPDAQFNHAAIPRTLVYALDVEEMTCKHKKPKKERN